MEFVITQGQFQVAPIPPASPEAPEGSVAGYMLNVTDAASGIVVRISMEHGNASTLGKVLAEHTEQHPEYKQAQVEVFGAVPPQLHPVDGNGAA